MVGKVNHKFMQSWEEDTIKTSLKDRESTTINDVMIVKSDSIENSMQLYDAHSQYS